jgi:hypothetical protein
MKITKGGEQVITELKELLDEWWVKKDKTE